ncbi:roadblock/LC7 domain-containing protein [Euzebya tangerina]|uniref:roadblock/LC7 domain-containing protein n=1 Tax=Euzebya tangerina TaxID=591198 RepID=UPI000E3144A2|nr:roadblock/LC7 domain-containing protein [Euzebya tangerina]
MKTETDVNWLLTAFTDRTPGVIESVVVSVDGLLIAQSSGLDRATADRIAAVASSLASITRGASRVFDGGSLRQVLVAYENGYIVLSSLREGAVLAVLTAAASDIGLVGHEMATLGQQVGGQLSPQLIESMRTQLPR